MLIESIVAFMVELIGSLIIEEVKYLYNVKEQICNLKIKLRYLQSFLRQMNEREKQGNCSNDLLKTHIEEITKLVRDIEIVTDIYMFVLYQESLLKKCMYRPCNLVYIHRVGVKIDQIQRKVQEAVGMLNDLGNAGSMNEEEQSSSGIRSRM